MDPGRARAAESGVAESKVAESKVAESQVAESQVDESEVSGEEDLPPIPWHLWLLAGALAVYLGYRAMQGIEWILGVMMQGRLG